MLQLVVLSVAKGVANAEGNRKIFLLRLNQSDLWKYNKNKCHPIYSIYMRLWACYTEMSMFIDIVNILYRERVRHSKPQLR